MTTENRENLCRCNPASPQLYQFLEKVDSDLAQKAQEGGCLHCFIGKLHRSDYKRKPRGGPQNDDEVYRDSFCCDEEGCRKRHTPPSVRFLGRKVYWSFIVVFISAMRHGLKPGRVQILREKLNIDRRTLDRWRDWWLETFVRSSFWKAVRARFAPLLCEKTLPLSLCEAFDNNRRDGFLELLKFLAPITTTSIPLERLI